MTKGTARRFAITAVLLLVMVGSVVLFSVYGEAFFPAYRVASRTFMAALASLTSVLSPSVSVCDFLLVALVVLAVVSLACCVARRRSILAWFSRVLLVVSALATVVVCGWALNHYAPPLSQ